MSFFESIRRGFVGWGKVITGNEMAAAYFDSSRFGLLAAVTFYMFAVLFTIVLQAAKFGMPDPMVLSVGLIVQNLPLVVVSMTTPLTYLALRLPSSPRELLVPAVYLVAIVIMVLQVITLLDPQGVIASLGILAFFLFRAARIVSGLGRLSALAYSILNVVLLVGLPAALYMQMPGSGPI